MKIKLVDGIEYEAVELKEDNEFEGHLISINSFINNILDGSFIDYDGHCRFVIEKDNKKYKFPDISYCIEDDLVTQGDNIYCSLLMFCLYNDIKEVVWYNR